MNKPSANPSSAGLIAGALVLGFLILGAVRVEARPGFDDPERKDSKLFDGADRKQTPKEKRPKPVARPRGVSLTLDRWTFSDEDIDRTYGSLASYGLRLDLQASERMDVILGLSYARGRGDPYYDLNMDAGRWARLSLLPVEIGLRADILEPSRQRTVLGFCLLVTRVMEENPALRSSGDEPVEKLLSWHPGARLLLAHEWRLGERAQALGVELSLTGQFLPGIDSGYYFDNDPVSSGLWSLGFYLTQLVSPPKKGAGS